MRKLILAAVLVAAATTAVAGPPRITPQSMALTWSSGLYVYDGSGDIVSIGSDVAGGNVYRYDGARRLVEGTANTTYANHQSFTYDAFGNVREVVSQSQLDGGTPPVEDTAVMGLNGGTNRLTSLEPCSNRVVTCIAGQYDEAGNQLTSLNGESFDYDALEMMSQRRDANSTHRYLYNAGGERIAVLNLICGTSTVSSRDYFIRRLDGKVIRQIHAGGSGSAATWESKEDYVYRDGLLLATITGSGSSEARRHMHLDHLGTPRLITDDRGYKVARHTYWPFGSEAPGSEIDPERMKFTGQERDFGDGPGRDLDYMHARYYGPVAARFLSVDPAADKHAKHPQRWNRYAYAGNNPMRFFDPDGRRLEEVEFKGHTYLLDSKIAADARVLLDGIKDNKLPLTVSFAFRTTGEQQLIFSNFNVGLSSATMVATPGHSRHEAGFAFDLNGLGRLDEKQKATFDSILAKTSFSRLKGDPPHIDADPTQFGYASRDAAIKENQEDYHTRFGGYIDSHGVPYNETNSPDEMDADPGDIDPKGFIREVTPTDTHPT